MPLGSLKANLNLFHNIKFFIFKNTLIFVFCDLVMNGK